MRVLRLPGERACTSTWPTAPLLPVAVLLMGCTAAGSPTLLPAQDEQEGRDGDASVDASATPQDGGSNGGAAQPADGGRDDGPAVDAGAGAGGSPAILFAESFEGTADDSVPAGFHSFVSYVRDGVNTKSGGTYALVDTTRAHGGQKALHVRGGSQPAMITRSLPESTRALFIRVWVFLAGAIGHAPGRNHETLIGLRRSVGAAHDEVRFGEIKGVIGVNEVPSDNIAPRMDQWGQGPEIGAGTWHCIEVAFRGDLAMHEVRAWSDGREVFAVNDPNQWQNGPLSPTFLDGKFVELILGWHSFSNYSNEVWFDDMVVASERVGCD